MDGTEEKRKVFLKDVIRNTNRESLKESWEDSYPSSFGGEGW